MNRVCTSCQETKILCDANFYHHKECKHGFDSACRVCRNRQRNEWRVKHKERLLAKRRDDYAADNGEAHKQREIARQIRAPLRTAAKNLMSGVRVRSLKLGCEPAPELRNTRFIESWLARQPNCECCSIPFHLGLKHGQKNDASPSFDRFDLSEAYTLKNTALICWRCNNIKRNYHESDLREVADWMQHRRGDEVGKLGEAA